MRVLEPSLITGFVKGKVYVCVCMYVHINISSTSIGIRFLSCGIAMI